MKHAFQLSAEEIVGIGIAQWISLLILKQNPEVVQRVLSQSPGRLSLADTEDSLLHALHAFLRMSPTIEELVG